MLLGHARTSLELQTLLNYHSGKEGDEGWEPGERQNLERLKMAIKYKQKKVSCCVHGKESKIYACF
jgi:transient receptor potential cation channel subfamily C protein 4